MDVLWNGFVTAAHIIAAGAAIILALWSVSHRQSGGPAVVPLAVAMAASTLWALATVALGTASSYTEGLVSLSYLAWLWALYRLFARDERDKNMAPVRAVVFSLAFVEAMQFALLAARLQYADVPEASSVILGIATMFRLLFCVGALVLVHNLYAGADRQPRQSLRWPAAALGLMWLYDLNLYTIAYLNDGIPSLLIDFRALSMLAMVALLAYGALREKSDLRFKPSRSFAFQSFSLLVIGAYLIVMVALAQAVSYAGSDFARFVQIAFLVLASVLALIFLPSKRVRGWVRVTLSKHLFKHRYDYRAEWLRFTQTIGRAGPEAAPLHERTVQAVADVTDSPAGLLLIPHEDGGLTVDARWRWPGIEVPAVAMTVPGARFFEKSQFILDIDDIRAGRQADIPQDACPRWLLDDHTAWALVPLLHYERLAGIVVLARPTVARRLDWEDFDLLRVVGRQLASYLAEQASQDALGESQRFEEFNRRNAFVMHDIKNLASQLSLLASNAEKHAENPEFRRDMILTLRNSSDKLQTLLNRLGRYGAQSGGAAQDIRLDHVADRLAQQYAATPGFLVLGREPCVVRGYAEALEQALVHLVQNAIEAGEEGAPVHLDLRTEPGTAIIEIVDAGCGMSSQFIRTSLFKPFHSSKAGGFGIGAFEARELIRGMGGRLDVESREGVGTRFLIRLPRTEQDRLAPLGPQDESQKEAANG